MKTKALLAFLFCFFSSSANAELTPSFTDFSLAPESAPSRVLASVGYLTQFQGVALILIDFEYRRSIGDRFSLIWSPLPLGVEYRLISRDGLESAVSWNLGLAHLSSLGLKPRFNSFSRQRLSSWSSLEVGIEYFTFTPFNEMPASWTLGFSLGTRLELSKNVSLAPAAQVVFEDVILRRLFANVKDERDLEREFRVAYPLVLGLTYRLGDHRRIGFEYTYRGLGLPSEFRAHNANVHYQTSW